LGLLHELVPTAKIIAVLVNPNYQPAEQKLRDVEDAAARLGVQLVVLRTNNESEFDTAFTTLVQRGAGGLLVAASPFSYSRHGELPHWRHAIVCRQSMNGASLSPPGDS
jgi:putative ABC transport system substrate-binding protein